MDKKTKIKAGLMFGTLMAVLCILQGLLTHSNLTLKVITGIIISSLVGAALSGFLYGWLIGILVNSKRAGKNKKETM